MTSLPCNTLPAQRLIHNDFLFEICPAKETWEPLLGQIVLDSSCVCVPMSLDLLALEEVRSQTCNKYCLALHIASSE